MIIIILFEVVRFTIFLRKKMRRYHPASFSLGCATVQQHFMVCKGHLVVDFKHSIHYYLILIIGAVYVSIQT